MKKNTPLEDCAHVLLSYCIRYEIQLNAAKKTGIRKGAVGGLLMGVIFCLMFGTYGLVGKSLSLLLKTNLRLLSGILVWSATCSRRTTKLFHWWCPYRKK